MPRAAVAALAVCLAAVPARGNDWPQFLGPTRNGVAADADVRSEWPAGGPPILYESNYFTLWQYGQSPASLRATLERMGYRHHYLVCPARLAKLATQDLQTRCQGGRDS